MGFWARGGQKLSQTQKLFYFLFRHENKDKKPKKYAAPRTQKSIFMGFP